MEEDFQEEERARLEREQEEEKARKDHMVTYATSPIIDTVSGNNTT